MSDEKSSLFIDVTVEGERLIVVPEQQAARELRTYSVLTHAQFYSDVIKDEDAVRQVAQMIETDPDLLTESEKAMTSQQIVADRAARGEPFDAGSFFGDEWDMWIPDARLSTAAWLQENTPELFARLGSQDTEWGMFYEPAPYIAADRRDELVAGLTDLGFVVHQRPGLADAYVNPEPV